MKSPTRRLIVSVILILGTGFIVYANTFGVPFVMDDELSITQNPLIKDLKNFYANSSGYEFLPNRYIGILSFALNYHFGEFGVFGYHLVNLLIHLTAALLVFAVLRLTFRTPFFQPLKDQSQVQGNESKFFDALNFIPLLAALLFVLHPIQTQAVTYVVQRLTSLATLFYLLSLGLYILARLGLQEGGSGRGKGRGAFLLALSVISAVLAMKTKEIAFTLPVAVAVYELFFFQGKWKKRFVYLLPILATLPIIPLTIIAASDSDGGLISEIDEQSRVQTDMTRSDYLFTQFRVIVTYLRVLIFPVHQNLDYDYPIYTSFFTPEVFLSFLVLTSLMVSAALLYIFSRRDRPSGWSLNPLARLVSFGIVWFFLTLSVESSIIPIFDVIFEHRLYLPGFGAAAAFASALYWLAVRLSPVASTRVLGLTAAVLVLALGTATVQRNHVWGDALRLWEDVASKSPDKGRPWNNLGVALEERGRRAEAFSVLKRAIAVDPDYHRSYYNLADLYLVSDRPESALPLLRKTMELKSDFTKAYVSYAAALFRAGRYREVVLFMERNLERVGGNGEARFYLGAAYAFLGDRDGALRELQVVSKLDPELAASLAGLLGRGMSHGNVH